MVTLSDIENIMERVSTFNGHFTVEALDDRGYLLQYHFLAPDAFSDYITMQRGRKWYVSRYSVPSEVVQTMFLAVKTALTHELHETFKLDGVSIFSPHQDVFSIASNGITNQTRETDNG